MPIKVQGDLPAKEILERENIFVMDENRAMHQDIRPIQILIVNLMPLKEETELQLLRSLSNTPLQIDVTFLTMNSHESKNTSTSHLNKFYLHFQDVKENKYDGMIVTGAPVENMEFEEVDYWKEITEIMDWSETHVTSTIFLCWAAQASLYHFYGLKKRQLPQKMFGLFWHRVLNRKIPLVRGFDDVFLAPHSRHTEVSIDDIRATKEITILAESDEGGCLAHRQVFGLFVEVSVGSGLDAHRIVQEVEVVEIEGDDLLFGVIALQLDGYHPLYGFLKEALHGAAGCLAIQLLRQLLGDGGASSGIGLSHESSLHDGSAQGTEVDA